ncbi:hypothetical protein CDAR_527661 [Caerostris darwini]|uniref:Uncharacterized protein n=1 Tax=Caerostris darwini TaxID=1538125 RepID=A0AAV4R9A1_9ARAC|nr:hypothetical protein CDAR_527661 [Caerostris darwini]
MAPSGFEPETCGTERQSASHSAIQALYILKYSKKRNYVREGILIQNVGFLYVCTSLSFSPLLGKGAFRVGEWQFGAKAEWKFCSNLGERGPVRSQPQVIRFSLHVTSFGLAQWGANQFTPLPLPPPFHHSLPIFVYSKNAPSDLFSIFSSAVGLGGDALARYSSWADIGLFKIQFGFMK